MESSEGPLLSEISGFEEAGDQSVQPMLNRSLCARSLLWLKIGRRSCQRFLTPRLVKGLWALPPCEWLRPVVLAQETGACSLTVKQSKSARASCWEAASSDASHALAFFRNLLAGTDLWQIELLRLKGFAAALF